jgi:4-amino-4-deoxy-L-arabinose transferase-like glycosyltransferase
LNKLLVAAAVFFILLFVYVALSRIGYPFELEWMEGGSVEHLQRVVEGEPIYTPPTPEFISYIYTPFYYYAAVPIAKITGINLLPLRIVSFASTLLLSLIIFLFMKKETDSKFYGVLAGGLFIASFRLGGAWFDLARVDMLHILLMLIAVYLLRFHKTAHSYFIAALIAGLSFLTKQTAALIFAPIGLYLLIKERRNSWFFNITFAFIVIFTTAYYTATTDGWYWFWNFTLPATHHWNKKYLIIFWTYDLIKPFAISLLFSVFYFIVLRKKDKNTFLFYISLVVGIVLSTWLSRLHYGGYSNVLIPVYLLIIILGIMGFKSFSLFYSDKNNYKLLPILASLALLFQFITLIYSPRAQIPTKVDESAGWELVNKIKSFDGDVYIFPNPYLARLAGKKVYAHGMLIVDLITSNTKYSRKMKETFDGLLKKHKFAAVIDYSELEYHSFLKYYRIKEKIFAAPEVFLMQTGFTTRPEYIYIPKK